MRNWEAPEQSQTRLKTGTKADMQTVEMEGNAGCCQGQTVVAK